MTQQDGEVQEITTVSEPTRSQQVVQQTKVVKSPISVDSPQKTYQTKKVIFRSYQAIWYVLGVIEVLLAFRIVLKLLGASTFSTFTNFVYAVSGAFALPFSGILQTSGTSGMVLEWSTLIAMAVYAIVAYGVVALFQFVKPTNPEEVGQSVDR